MFEAIIQEPTLWLGRAVAKAFPRPADKCFLVSLIALAPHLFILAITLASIGPHHGFASSLLLGIVDRMPFLPLALPILGAFGSAVAIATRSRHTELAIAAFLLHALVGTATSTIGRMAHLARAIAVKWCLVTFTPALIAMVCLLIALSRSRRAASRHKLPLFVSAICAVAAAASAPRLARALASQSQYSSSLIDFKAQFGIPPPPDVSDLRSTTLEIDSGRQHYLRFRCSASTIVALTAEHRTRASPDKCLDQWQQRSRYALSHAPLWWNPSIGPDTACYVDKSYIGPELGPNVPGYLFHDGFLFYDTVHHLCHFYYFGVV